MKSVYLLLIFAVAGCHSLKDNKVNVCPPKEDVKPCICSIGIDGKLWISCVGVTSADELRQSVQRLAGYTISSFDVSDSYIGILPADIFRGLYIESLVISYTNITGLSEGINRPPFLGLERSLEALEIKEAFLRVEAPLAGLSLSHLKKLSLLQLESNVAPNIGNDWFESGPYGLEQLFILDSYTKTIGSHAFAFLKNLKNFALTGGSVSVVSREMFPKPALVLEEIDLSNNALSSLPADMFTSMPSLMEVYLDANAFTGIDEKVWAPVWNQLTHVFLFDNGLNCDENMRWMYKYRLPEFLHGRCSTPEHLKNKELMKLTLKDFDGKI